MSKNTEVTGNSETVIVACKLPHGLIIEIGKPGEDNYQRYQLRGQLSRGIQNSSGFALTTIPKRDWEQWLAKTGRKLKFVQQGLVFAEADTSSATDHAKDNVAQKTGLERLKPTDAPKGLDVDKAHMANAISDLAEMQQAVA